MLSFNLVSLKLNSLPSNESQSKLAAAITQLKNPLNQPALTFPVTSKLSKVIFPSMSQSCFPSPVKRIGIISVPLNPCSIEMFVALAKLSKNIPSIKVNNIFFIYIYSTYFI